MVATSAGGGTPLAWTLMRRSGGRVGGGALRGGSSASSTVVASVTACTARSNASSVAADTVCTPPTLRTYWREAASISSAVAGGWSPRSMVMLRHMTPRYVGPQGRGWRHTWPRFAP